MLKFTIIISKWVNLISIIQLMVSRTINIFRIYNNSMTIILRTINFFLFSIKKENLKNIWIPIKIFNHILTINLDYQTSLFFLIILFQIQAQI
jgi:hypothetical protein